MTKLESLRNSANFLSEEIDRLYTIGATSEADKLYWDYLNTLDAIRDEEEEDSEAVAYELLECRLLGIA